MIIFIDIDKTICYTPDNGEYSQSTPIHKNIKKANDLYDKGNTIIYWTARGIVTGINWQQLTKKQLKDWGVKFNEIRFDKPYYDVFIDDKAMNVKDWK